MAKTRLAEVAEPAETSGPVELPVVRFTHEMIDDWLIGRFDDVWPGRPPEYWRTRIADLSRSNDALLITNGAAVLCAVRTPHPMSGKPDVNEVFAFARAARPAQDGTGNWVLPDQDQRPLLDLYRHARAWRTGMGAFRMVACKCSDITVADARRYLTGRMLLDMR